MISIRKRKGIFNKSSTPVQYPWSINFVDMTTFVATYQMETAGVEPASEGIVTHASTCVVYLLNLNVTLPINRRCGIQPDSSLLRALRRRGWSVACLVWDPDNHPHKRWMSGSAGHLGCCALCVSFSSYRRVQSPLVFKVFYKNFVVVELCLWLKSLRTFVSFESSFTY